MNKTSISTLYPKVNNFKTIDIESVYNDMQMQNRPKSLKIHEIKEREVRLRSETKKVYEHSTRLDRVQRTQVFDLQNP